jgi:hypothetical protein
VISSLAIWFVFSAQVDVDGSVRACGQTGRYVTSVYELLPGSGYDRHARAAIIRSSSQLCIRNYASVFRVYCGKTSRSMAIYRHTTKGHGRDHRSDVQEDKVRVEGVKAGTTASLLLCPGRAGYEPREWLADLT